MRQQLSLRRRLQLLAGLALVPAFVIVVVNLVTARALRLEEIEDYALRMSEVLQHEVIRGLTGAAVLLVAAGNAPVVAEPGQSCEAYLASFAPNLPTVIDIGALATSGEVYCRSGETGADDLEDIARSLIPVTAARHIAVGSFAETPRGAALPIAMAIRDGDGTILRYIVITVALTALEDIVAERSELAGSRALVADADGTILLRYPTAEGSGAGDPVPAPYLDLTRSGTAGTTWLGQTARDRHIVGYQPMTEVVPLAFIFEMPSAAAMAPINRALLFNIALAITGAIVAMALATWYGRKFIQRPVDHVMTVLAARRSGHRGARTGLDRRSSEIGSVGMALDDLFDELDDREAEQQRLQEQRDIAARELQHRVKNLLAIIEVIAKQTLSRRTEAPEVQAFEDRIRALIRANGKLLSGGDGQPVDLGSLVSGGIDPFVQRDDDQVRLHGPPLEVNARTGLALSMAVHELATNAARHGALRSPHGEVAVTWGLDDGNFQFSWDENGEASSAPPAPPGFGTMMLKRVLEAETRGRVEMEFAREGFRFSLTAPWEVLAAAA